VDITKLLRSEYKSSLTRYKVHVVLKQPSTSLECYSACHMLHVYYYWQMGCTQRKWVRCHVIKNQTYIHDSFTLVLKVKSGNTFVKGCKWNCVTCYYPKQAHASSWVLY